MILKVITFAIGLLILAVEVVNFPIKYLDVETANNFLSALFWGVLFYYGIRDKIQLKEEGQRAKTLYYWPLVPLRLVLITGAPIGVLVALSAFLRIIFG